MGAANLFANYLQERAVEQWLDSFACMLNYFGTSVRFVGGGVEEGFNPPTG